MYRLFLSILFVISISTRAQQFSMEQVTAYPFPSELTSASKASKIAVAINKKGLRNVFVAEGPSYSLRQLTGYTRDDGQELTSLSVSANGKWVVYVRGGEHSGNRNRSVVVNPTHDPVIPKIEIWVVPFAGGKPRLLSEGDYPVISPNSNKVVFIKENQIWWAAIDGLTPPVLVSNTRGEPGSLQWSPDGSKFAFVCDREDHSFIGVYTGPKSPVTWLEPSFMKDASPRWSPDSKRIAFIRTPASDRSMRPGGNPATASSAPSRPPQAPNSQHMPWEIWTADISTGKGSQLWKAPETLRGSIPTTDGGTNLHWMAGGKIVFVSYHDGWPHIYSISDAGGEPVLLTPGNFMVEHLQPSADGKFIFCSVNTGADTALDIDRRHIASVSIDKPGMELLTNGTGIETYPVQSGDGQSLAFFSATARQPVLPAVMDLSSKKIKLIGESMLDKDFPLKEMIVPKQIIYQSPDSVVVHAQLFMPNGGAGKKPAIVYVHGGPQRQMLLGWHHMDYYSIDYALNQYLASMGYVVLSINFRLGVGYGYELHKPIKQGANYIDVKAGADWLASQSWVDSNKIMIYGGSHGGGLVATALARNSDRFKAGVLIHGGTQENMDKWKSPVLVIHGDDDRNVDYNAGVLLIKQFGEKKIPFEYLSIPDDSHHWMRYFNVLKVNRAVAEFLDKQIKKTAAF
jgi:dipeptidyl aminopeptidase/acylaminoacyl peptidase